MKSMTGYGYGEACSEDGSLSIEIRSYKSRFLEILVNLPPSLNSFEQFLRASIGDRCERGKVEVLVRLKEYHSETRILVDTNLARSYYESLRVLRDELGLDENIRLATIVAMEGVLQIEKNRNADRYQDLLERALGVAMEQLDAQRRREGDATAQDILHHLGVIEQQLTRIRGAVPILEENIKVGLRTRFQEVLGDLVDENRILAETAVLLMKYSISEELARLEAHLTEFRREVAENPSPGKKLDFLCQEMNREINTIGSKSPLIEVSRSVVTIKDALENIREQLRNVE